MMKKLLLITVILLLQSFPSFGNPNGKGIICVIEDENKNIYLDKEKKLPFKFGFDFVDNKVSMKIILREKSQILFFERDSVDFVTSSKNIEWGSEYERWKLDRKSLELKELKQNKIVGGYKCEVFPQKVYSQKFEELKKKYQNHLDKLNNNSDNKI